MVSKARLADMNKEKMFKFNLLLTVEFFVTSDLHGQYISMDSLSFLK